jgi:phosphoribosylformylglycinamidine synthase
MKVAVRVLPRPEVLDSQGRAVEATLQRLGFGLDSCRVGKYIVLEVNEASPEQAVKKATEMAKTVLHNPLIETFEVEVVGERS